MSVPTKTDNLQQKYQFRGITITALKSVVLKCLNNRYYYTLICELGMLQAMIQAKRIVYCTLHFQIPSLTVIRNY